MNNKNILVTSISKKVPLLKAIKKAGLKLNQQCQIIGADINDNCIGKFFVDKFWLIPKIEELNINDIIEYCFKYSIGYIIPTRDGDLSFFALHKQILYRSGIAVMVSNLDAIDTCVDKLHFFEKCHILGFPVIETTIKIDEINSDFYVVKERYGAGSKLIGLKLTKKQAEHHAENLKEPIFQPFISGKEISVDLYIDLKGKTKGAISRLRQLVIDGESQITTTIKNKELEAICFPMAEQLKLYGHIVFQVIIDDQNKFHILECNSRFGGASTLSIEMGLDSFYWFLLESKGINLDSYPFYRSPIEKIQIRYAEDLIINGDCI